MSKTRTSQFSVVALAGSLVVLLIACVPAAHGALAYNITVDTTQAQAMGGPWEVVLRLYANTIHASPEPFDDTATITNVQFGGPFVDPIRVGDTVGTGRLSPLVLHDDENDADGEFIYSTSFATNISFNLVLAGPTINGTNPDTEGYGFEIGLDLDNAQPFLDSGGITTLEIYTFPNSATPTIDANSIVTVTAAPVPEPTALAAAGLVSSFCLRRRRRA